MPDIGEEMQQRHSAKEPGLWWGQSAPQVRCGTRPMAPNRASRRACPENRLATIKLISAGRVAL